MKVNKATIKVILTLLLFSLVFLIGSIFSFSSTLKIKNKYIETQAEITKITEDEDVYVSFYIDEELKEVKLSEYSSTWKVGNKIKVYYNPNNYQDVYTKNFMVFMPSILSGVAVVLLIIATIQVFKVLYRREDFKKNPQV